jgi:hypothetical protein
LKLSKHEVERDETSKVWNLVQCHQIFQK